MVDDRAGQHITILEGRYRLERVLGEGAFGRVYIAHDSRLQRTVAIKELLAAKTTADPRGYTQYLERFEREARAAGSVFHANIVNVFELAIDTDGNYYLIMEYVERGNLRDLLQRVERLPVTRALSITLDIARALEAIHDVGIVHRDLKPANIMLSSRGVAKLTDFGIAQISHESHRTQASTGHPGTPLYMSPEQRQNSDYLDGRSDLYSLGLVFYEMLSGEPYGSRKQPLETMRTDLSEEILAIVARLTERDVARRYQSAEEAIADLSTAFASESRAGGTGQLLADTTVLDDRQSASETVIDPLPAHSLGQQSASVPYTLSTSDSQSSGIGMRSSHASIERGVPTSPTHHAPAKRTHVPLVIAFIGGVVAVAAVFGAVLLARGGALIAGPATTPVQSAGVPTRAALLSETATPSPSSTAIANAIPSPTPVATATPTPAPATNTPTPSPTVRPSATIRPDFQAVSNQKYAIAFSYPKAWQRSDDETDQDTIFAFRLSPSAAFLVAKEDNPTATTLDAYIDDEIKTVIAQHPGWKTGTRVHQATMLGGQPAQIADFLVPTTTGQSYHYYVFTLRPKQAWGLLFFMPTDDFAKNQKDVDDVVRSFMFCASGTCSTPSAQSPSILLALRAIHPAALAIALGSRRRPAR